MRGAYRHRWPAFVALVILALAAPEPAVAGPARGFAYSIQLSAPIDPATQRWIGQAIDEAVAKRATVAIIRLDTPGGLDTSMRAIIKDMIAAPLPVIVYVSPGGARAASAGLFITQAADVAAMAPQTNIGSATPITIGPGEPDKVLGRKIRNDAAAYVRALAEGHGRDADLAEQMVRRATNVTAAAALRAGLIDIVATDQVDLLRKLDGFRIKGPKAGRLDTSGLRIVRRDMPFQYDLLELLVNPTIAYLLMLAGLAGIMIELFSPGLYAPGVLGVVSLVLGLYGTAQLPVTAAGIVLLLLALALLVAELKIASHGVLGAAGVAALISSGLLLFDTDTDAVGISVPVVVVTGVVLGGLVLLGVSKALAARHRPVSTGLEQLIGRRGTVRVALDPIGQVFVDGALWRARPLDPAVRLQPGDAVSVASVEGLTLAVQPQPSSPTRHEEANPS